MDALLDAGFQWDGSSSDLAQQFYRAHVRLSSAAPSALPETMPFAHEELPDPIQTRLSRRNLRFEQLPPLLQRALVWDSGYVYAGSERELVRVYTSENRSMAQLAVSLESFRRAGCSARNCTSQYRSQFCNGRQMLSVSHCVTEDIDSQKIHVAMWAMGSGKNASDTRDDSEIVPDMSLLRHEWVDANINYLVYAIHTVSAERQPSWSLCPASGTDQATGLTVPCGVYRLQGNKTKWQPPPAGELVSQWLSATENELKAEDGLSTKSLIGIVGGSVAVVLVIVIGVWCFCRRRRRRPDDAVSFSSEASMSQPIMKPAQAASDADTYHLSTTPVGLRRKSQQRRVEASNLHGGSITTNTALQALVDDPNLEKKRLPFDEIQFDQQISRGAFGEVWLAVYQNNQVAVKRVRQDKRPTYQDLQDFTAEIQLTASLQHPNLVGFIGVTWRSIDTLCMVIEYMANGDLQAYLDAHMDTLEGFWTAEKTAIALGVAQALVYLHSQSPPLIHRDVKAKNVLLDDKLGARLVDFGVSRRLRSDMTMTAGVGTPFWTAPEIMEGVRYAESSDMYSFGVFLTELETCRLPYHDYQSRDHLQYDPTTANGLAKGRHAAALGLLGAPSIQSTPVSSTESGDTSVPGSLRPFLIMNLVIDGSIRPSVSKSCPDWLRELATSCFQADPLKRPTAEHVVEILRRQWSMLE